MALMKTLHGLSVYVDGIDYVGVAESFTPPDIVLEVEESNMPGHGGTIDIPTGRLEKLEAVFTVADAFPALETLVGRPSAVDTQVHFVKVSTDGAASRTVEYQLTGLWTQQSVGEVSGRGGGGGGAAGRCQYTVSIRTLTHRIDGREQRHIDLEQNIHRVAGQDVNASLTNALRRGRRGGFRP
ncbi:MAG: phage major tail tube protein [Rhodospirillaceae bacterium]|nr:phage major tail tube protein [Rhodospirillaceae bacterium]